MDERGDRTKWTDIVQTLCAVGLLALGVIGYVYTVIPLYSKSLLEEEASRLKINVEKLTSQQESLKKEYQINRQRLSDYRNSVRPYVVKQFIGKIRAELERYERAPTIIDTAAMNGRAPASATGRFIIETNLKNEEILLLPEPDRTALIKTIKDFITNYSNSAAFDSPLDIPMRIPLTDALAIIGQQKWREALDRFPAESQRLKGAQEAFKTAISKLQVQLAAEANRPARTLTNSNELPGSLK